MSSVPWSPLFFPIFFDLCEFFRECFDPFFLDLFNACFDPFFLDFLDLVTNVESLGVLIPNFWQLMLPDQAMLILDVKISKFIDTSLLDVDLHENYIRITIKDITAYKRHPSYHI